MQDTHLSTTALLVADEPDILLLRHSIREEITGADPSRAVSAPLTKEGRELAWSFGRTLPTSRPIVLSYSRVPRCEDTAHFIRRGVIENSGRCEIEGPRTYLEAPFIQDPLRVMQMFITLGPSGFASEWASGRLGPSIVDDIHSTGRSLLGHLLSSRDSQSIRICITHDLTIVSLLALALDVSSPTFPWPGYLDGPALTFHDETAVALYRGLKATLA